MATEGAIAEAPAPPDLGDYAQFVSPTPPPAPAPSGGTPAPTPDLGDYAQFVGGQDQPTPMGPADLGDYAQFVSPTPHASNALAQTHAAANLNDHSVEWNTTQQAMAQRAAIAGLPPAPSGNARLSDAIQRSHQAGYKFPHFTGPDAVDPTGDRTVTLDMEALVGSLKQQEDATTDPGAKQRISQERAYWEDELRTSGMSAEQWRQQTGQPDPVPFPNFKNPEVVKDLAKRYADAAMGEAQASLVKTPKATINQEDSIGVKANKAIYNSVSGLVDATTSDAGFTMLMNPVAGIAGIGATVVDMIERYQEVNKTPPGSPERVQFAADVGTFAALPVVFHTIGKFIGRGGERGATTKGQEQKGFQAQPEGRTEGGQETQTGGSDRLLGTETLGPEEIGRPLNLRYEGLQDYEGAVPNEHLYTIMEPGPAHGATFGVREGGGLPELTARLEETKTKFSQPAGEGGETVPEAPSPDIAGGGAPPEISTPARGPSATKNVYTELQRQERGLPEVTKSASRDFGTAWDQAQAELATDPSRGQRLVEEMNNNPRALGDTENAILLNEQIRAQNEHNAAIEAVNDNPSDTVAQARLESARDTVQNVYDATAASGTATGRGLNARKMLANNDFSLAKMEAETRAVVNKGKPLSEKQTADVKALHKRIADADAKIAAFEAREQFEAALKEAKAGKVQYNQSEFMRKSYDAARERIAAKRGRVFAGIDPTTLVDEAIIGAYHISRGVKTLADFSIRMVEELGDYIKPYLRDIYAKAKTFSEESRPGRTTKLTPEQREANALAGEKKRIVTATEKLRAKVEAEDFTKAERKPPRMDKEKAALLFEAAKVRNDYHRGIVEAQLRNRSGPQKVLGGVGEVFNTTRALMTSFDLSAILRQGGFIGFGHPVRSAKATPSMFRALRSEKGQFMVEQEIRDRPNAPLYAQSKLYLSQHGPGTKLSQMEEAYMGRWSKKIPGLAASERAYTTFLNRLRADSFDAMAETLTKTGTPTLEEAKAISNFINVATGRGEMGKHATAAQTLNTAFFAPRYVLSRFQLLAGQPFYKGSARTRSMIAKEYARTLAGLAVVYALGEAAGGDVEIDPRSSDFGKIRFGDTRLDPLFGLSQSAVLLSRLATGETITQSGKTEPIRGSKVKFGHSTSFDVGTRFLRSKLAPIPGTAVNVVTGADVMGQPVTLDAAAANLLMPIGFKDILKALEEQGVPRGTALSMLALMGMSLQTYEPRKSSGTVKLAKPKK